MQPKSRTSLFILLSFLLGAVSGTVLGMYVFAGKGKSSGYSSRNDQQAYFASKLKLNKEQEAQVDSLIEGRRAAFEGMRKEFGKAYKAERESLRVDIRKVLSADQNTLYDEFIKEMEERAEKRKKREKE
jgi:hypothetical protein